MVLLGLVNVNVIRMWTFIQFIGTGKRRVMGALADLDVFIKQHCKSNLALEVILTVEISEHLDGKIRYDMLSQDAKDVLDAWEVYASEVDKKIAR
jgi:hypothetical protein